MLSSLTRHVRQTISQRLQSLSTHLFRDRMGAALFVGSLVFFGIFWRVDVFMTDSAALVHGLGALGNGNLFIQQPYIGASLDNPGIYDGLGGPVARNYAQLVLSLPILFAIRGIQQLANLHVAIVALWHLLLLALFVLVGRLLDRERLLSILGSLTVLVFFTTNLRVARQLPEYAPIVLSLQILTLVAAALSVLVCYRLLSDLHDRRLGLFAACALAVATPVGFWSSLPKRHVFTGLAVLLVLCSIHRSRAVDPDTPGRILPRATEFRCLAYAVVGLYAWIHAAEALFMLGALALVDLPTGHRRDRRTLGAIAVAFVLSTIPLFATNVLLAGDPLTPPRLLPDYVPTGGGPSTSPVEDSLRGGSTGIVGVVNHFSTLAIGGFVTLTTDLERVFHTYVRSQPGAISEMGGHLRYAGANLTVLESMPLATGLVSGIAVLLVSLRKQTTSLRSGLRTTDVLAATLGVTFAILYADRLPLHAQYTQRYLFPLYPLAIYGLARLPPIRRVIATRWRLALWTYAVTLCIGGQLLFAYVLVEDIAVGGAFQLHAILNLGLGVLLALALTLSTITTAADRLSAIALGLTTAAGTVFLLLSGLVYFPIGPYALPVIEVFNELVAAA